VPVTPNTTPSTGTTTIKDPTKLKEAKDLSQLKHEKTVLA
jgi:hypothetical protein